MPQCKPYTLAGFPAFVVILLGFSFRIEANSNSPEPAGGLEKKIAVLPFRNHTGRLKALEVVRPLIEKGLEEKGYRCIPKDSLRNILRKHRIRSMGDISRAAAGIIKHETQADYIVMAAVDLFQDGDHPEISVSMRILETAENKLVWLKTASGTGSDGIQLLGFGRISDIEVLADRVIRKMLSALDLGGPSPSGGPASGRIKVCMIPFENFSDAHQAGFVVFEQVMAILASYSVDIIEPGIAEELLLQTRFSQRGEVDFKTLKLLKQEFNIDIVLTGSVDLYNLAEVPGRTADPRIEMTLSVLDASTGGILCMSMGGASGKDRSLVFDIGRKYSMGEVTDYLIRELFRDSKFNDILLQVRKRNEDTSSNR